VNHEPLDAFPGADLDGIDEEENVDLFLNLHKIEDIDMSTDSSKRKRCEDEEEVSSHAVIPEWILIAFVFWWLGLSGCC